MTSWAEIKKMEQSVRRHMGIIDRAYDCVRIERREGVWLLVSGGDEKEATLATPEEINEAFSRVMKQHSWLREERLLAYQRGNGQRIDNRPKG